MNNRNPCTLKAFSHWRRFGNVSMRIQGDWNSRRIECALNNFTLHFVSTLLSCKNPLVSREKHDSHVVKDDLPLDLSLYVFLWLLYIKMRMNAGRRSAQLAQILEVRMRLHTASTWSGSPSPTSLRTPFHTLRDYAQHRPVDLGYSALPREAEELL